MNQSDTDRSRREKISLGNNMAWIDHLTIQCKGVKLQLTQGFDLQDSSAEVVSLFKHPTFVWDYVQCLDGVDARNVVEVGIKHGGSAIFFWNLLTPEKFCCIELNSGAEQLTAYIEKQELADRFTTHYNTDQGNKPLLEEILATRFGEEPLDIVLDDASHLYSPSMATFEVLFPKLKPGGLFFLEDWKVHLSLAEHGREPLGEEPPFHRMVHELLNVSMAHPDIIPTVKCFHNFVIIERGKAELDSKDFSIRSILDEDSKVFEY